MEYADQFLTEPEQLSTGDQVSALVRFYCIYNQFQTYISIDNIFNIYYWFASEICVILFAHSLMLFISKELFIFNFICA